MENIKALKILNDIFGYKEFRAPQDKIINDLIEGKNISVIMPTGGGKSLCYQIPALIREGVGIVISPLIALMEDQVNALKENGVNAVYINSTLSSEERNRIQSQIENGKFDLLYVSPELLLSQDFYNWLFKLKISLFAIDEAHCVSQWGHDFRPNYLNLSCLIEDFKDIPRIALTATANELTRNEILLNLGIDKENQYMAGFDRSNISYNIQSKGQDEKKQLLQYIEENHADESGIVYCISRKKTEEVARYLKSRGHNAYHFHAGLDNKTKSQLLKMFLSEDDIIIVATIAFGMGIDKPNVRFVCHIDISGSIEAYYQETGRAGRDGKPSVAWMLYGVQDVFFRQQLVNKSNADEVHRRIEQNALDAMFSLCEASHCRRQVLIGYFGDNLKEPCGNCDICLNPPLMVDATIIAQKVLSTISRTKQTLGVTSLIDILIGEKTLKNKKMKFDELSVFGIGKDYPKSDWRTVFRQLIVLGYVTIEPNKNLIWFTEKSKPLLRGETSLFLAKDIIGKKKTHRGFSPEDIKESFSYEEGLLFSKLKELRLNISKIKKMPAYLVFSDSTLIDMVLKKPIKESSMLGIEGVGYQKMNNYGRDFLKIIKDHV